MHVMSILVALVASALGLSEPELALALRGQVPSRTERFTAPSGKSSGRGIGAIVIDRPIADVWAALIRYEDRAEYQPRVEKVWVLEKGPDQLKVRMQLDASVTTIRYTAIYKLDHAAHTIRWALDKSAPDNNVADIDGGYQLAEVTPQRTLVVSRSWVDSGRSVPRFIQDYVARRSIPDLLRAVKNRVESGGVWKKK
jgi:hypothetical protein